MGLTRISWILKVLGAGGRSRSGFCWKLLGFNCFFIEIYWFLLKFVGFYWNLLNFQWNLLEFTRNPLEFNRFYWKSKENHCNPYWFTKHFLLKTIKNKGRGLGGPGGPPTFRQLSRVGTPSETHLFVKGRASRAYRGQLLVLWNCMVR